MRAKVRCLNCGIKWIRVTSLGSELELTEDLMYNCPNCNSNDYEPQSEHEEHDERPEEGD